MTFEIRQAKKEEMKYYRRMMAEAFLPPDVEDPDIELPATFTLCAFENGKMATSYVSLPFTMQYNGREQKVAGIAGISTTAEFRRRGYLRKITEKHFGQLKEEGKRPVAILWAAHAAIYQRYGYATVSNVNSYNVEPRYLQFSLGQPLTGECRVSSRDEFELLNKIYYQSIKEKTGYLHRSEITWKIGPFAPITKGGVFKILVYEEAGKPLGYVIYTVGKHPIQEAFQPHMQVRIRDLVWLTPSALQAIWEVFANQDLVRTVFWQIVPSDDPLPYLLLEPRMLNQRPYDGMMGRLVDVEKGLTGRGYDDEAKLTFEIIDDFCPWNQGTWCLETAKEGSHVKATTESPDLVMPVSTLAMLAFGHLSATRAAAIGRLDVRNDKSLADWDRVMKTKVNPHCPDQF